MGITLGFIFAGIFTILVAILGIFFNWCCVCLFCPKLHRRRLRRRRIRERRKWILREQFFSSPGMQLVPLTHQDYHKISTKDEDEEPREEDEDRDTFTRMEYGQPNQVGYDDEDDYEMGSKTKEKGRYEEGQINQAAKVYFDDKEEKDEEKNYDSGKDDKSVSSDSSNETCEPLLDLAAMELDLAKME